MVRLVDLSADTKKEDEGVWIEYREGLRLKIASTRNPEYREAQRKVEKKMRDSDKLEDYKDAIVPAVARFLLKDWENALDIDGKPMNYTPALGADLLAKREYEPLFIFICLEADRASNFEREILEDSEKN